MPSALLLLLLLQLLLLYNHMWYSHMDQLHVCLCVCGVVAAQLQMCAIILLPARTDSKRVQQRLCVLGCLLCVHIA
jgi:hypothetical protein